MIDDLQLSPLATTIDYYVTCLHEKAQAFLSKHAICDDAALRVGFADRTLGNQLPSARLKSGRELRALLQQAGILKENGRELFRGHVTVPLTNRLGETTGIYGLRLDVLPGQQPETTIGNGLFNAAALTTFDEIIVCKDVIDAWTFYAAGHNNAIAAQGIVLGGEDFAAVNRVLLADPDIVCDPFAGVERLRINFPEGTSVNEYAIKHASVDGTLDRRIRAASWIGGTTTQGATDAAAKEDTTTKHTKQNEDKAAPSPSPVPAAVDDLDVEQSATEVTIAIEDRRWRVRGLDRNPTIVVLKVNVMVFNDRTDRFHVDTLDLYHARSRRVYLKEAAEEVGGSENDLHRDIGQVLLKLEQLQQEQLAKGTSDPKPVELTDTDRSEALELLTDERLLDRILDDFEACGIVGERTGKLAGYLAATSRLLDKPLGLVIQSSSAAGKSALADSVLRFMPSEERFSCSAMTSQSLYYLGKENLRHKILSVAEEEGVRDASYQLKLLLSEGRLSLVATSKESGSGRTATERYEVEGPVALVMTTTALDVDPELMNRCLVVNVDESIEQTQAIHAAQRHADTLDGWDAESERKRLTTLHQNAQRCLRPIRVVNPYADQLKFIDHQARHRRNHQKYLGLIKAVTLLHQYQRTVKQRTKNGVTSEYIEVTRRDIVLANMIADWALGRSIDELAGPTRRLLIQLYDWIREQADGRDIELDEVQFTRREAREALGWSASPMRIHLERLCRHEYVVGHGGGNGKLYRYSLLYDGRGREGQPTFTGLIDSSSLTEPSPDSTPTNLSDQTAT
jgi:hypothetical protein